MATDLNLDDEVQAVENTTSTSTGLVTRLIALLKAGFESDANPFFDGAKCRTWDGNGPVPDTDGASGIIPILNVGGRIPRNVLDIPSTDRATETTRGVIRAWGGEGSQPERLSDGDVVPILTNDGQINTTQLPAASTTESGLVRRATPTEIANRANIGAYVTPSSLGSGVPNGFFVRKGGDVAISTDTLLPMTNEIRDAQSAYSLVNGSVRVPAGEYWVEAGGLFDKYGTMAITATATSQSLLSSEPFAVNIQTSAADVITGSASGYFNLAQERQISVNASRGDTGFKLIGVANVVTAWLKIWRL